VFVTVGTLICAGAWQLLKKPDEPETRSVATDEVLRRS